MKKSHQLTLCVGPETGIKFDTSYWRCLGNLYPVNFMPPFTFPSYTILHLTQTVSYTVP